MPQNDNPNANPVPPAPLSVAAAAESAGNLVLSDLNSGATQTSVVNDAVSGVVDIADAAVSGMSPIAGIAINTIGPAVLTPIINSIYTLMTHIGAEIPNELLEAEAWLAGEIAKI